MKSSSAPAKRRLLLALPQSLYDLSSGAAVSTRLLAYQLAAAGWAVRALCTSATESGQLGLPPEGARWPAVHRIALQAGEAGQAGGPPRWLIDDEGVQVEVWELPAGTRQQWAEQVGDAFDARSLQLLQDFAPQVYLSYGAEPRDHRLAQAARAAGSRVVLALHNLAYLQRPLPAHDALLMPSDWLAARYRGVSAQAFGTLLPPMWPADTAVARHDPVFFTFFNPEAAKGAELVLRLAAALPELPFLIVAGRAGPAAVAAQARAIGLEATALKNVTLSPGGVPVREVLALTRAVLVPSLVEEAAGRVAAEALANGIPALVSDSGALPEIAQPGGQVLALRRAANGLARVDAQAVEDWAAVLRAWATEAGWQAAAAQARASAGRWDAAVQTARADAWFSGLL